MAKLLVLFVLLLAFLSPSLSSGATYNGIDWWCSKTPHPNTCKNYLSHAHVPKEKSQFKKTTVHVALEESLKAQSHNKWLGSKCRNGKEKAAWADCLNLYEETITLLNHTLDPATKSSDYDVQTWLSAALTNLDTCRAGFVELNVSAHILPLMSNNVSALISNALSIQNGSIPPQTERYRDGFPSWLSGGDRRLLQSSSPAADLVVAQDGSGDYQTIAEALKAAAGRSGKGRFVVHVKSGVYKENLKIGSKLNNIMLIGDGLRFTIVTGSKSVGGGSTTFNSATVGTDLSLPRSLAFSFITVKTRS
jgi:pectinesterase